MEALPCRGVLGDQENDISIARANLGFVRRCDCYGSVYVAVSGIRRFYSGKTGWDDPQMNFSLLNIETDIN